VTVVIDASAMAAALIDSGRDGDWARRLIGGPIAAPHLMPAEVANILRRQTLGGGLSVDAASLALYDLVDLPIDYYAFPELKDRVWELRGSISAYDAWYVAVAEALDVPLATLDRRLTRANGMRCEFLTP